MENAYDMITKNLSNYILFDPLKLDVNEFYIISGYATPNMLSWYIKNLYHKVYSPIRISLIVGMAVFDGISINAHEGFIQLIRSEKPQEVEKLECSYIFDFPSVHSNLFIWAKNGIPKIAFTGSANFTQNSFVSHQRQDVMINCNPKAAMNYYYSLLERSIYIHHAEVEEYIKFYPTHPILDQENILINKTNKGGDESNKFISLSLLTKTGETGVRSGLNWGHRPGRNPNEAYIPLPHNIAKSGFFPLEKQHFTAITDDRHQLILRVEQQNNKAITTPARNSDLGEYFRNRLGLPNGAFVTRSDLNRYGRTDVAFVKLDEETYYMDFSS